MLQDELRFQEEFASTNLYWRLYRGPIHADLFRNNVMFDSTRLTGFFDFYFAGCVHGCLMSAVAINDWCIDPGTGGTGFSSRQGISGCLSCRSPFYT